MRLCATEITEYLQYTIVLNHGGAAVFAAKRIGNR